MHDPRALGHAARRWRRLPQERKWAFAEASIALAVARATLRVLPFRWIVPLLAHDGTGGPQEHARLCAWAMQRAAAIAPWKATCLHRALAGAVMLRRRGVCYVVHFGAKKAGAGEPLAAHAWLSVGDERVIGGSTADEYYEFRPA